MNNFFKNQFNNNQGETRIVSNYTKNDGFGRVDVKEIKSNMNSANKSFYKIGAGNSNNPMESTPTPSTNLNNNASVPNTSLGTNSSEMNRFNVNTTNFYRNNNGNK